MRYERLAMLALHLIFLCTLCSLQGRSWAQDIASSNDTNASTTNDPTVTITATLTTTSSSTTTIIATPPIPNRRNETISSNATSDPKVRYQLNCDYGSFCDKVERSVVAAIDEFTQVVNVKTLIIIRVNYYSFCDKLCANETYGWGAPTSQFTLPFEDGADLNYVYPQALAKQLAPYSSTSVWAPYDVNIEINHDMYMNSVDYDQAAASNWSGNGVPPFGKFWFLNDTTIESDQVDFRYIVLHELLHGMGFISAWGAYFYTDSSPFRALVDDIIDASDLELVTPGPYWFVNQDGGPAYVTGFQPTMIFDKYLINTVLTPKNISRRIPLSNVSLEMQNFCVQGSNAFIINFVQAFVNNADQTHAAKMLWSSLSNEKTLNFEFHSPTVANSSFNTNAYLRQTYRNMTLLTGPGVLTSDDEQYDRISNRPGMSISHLDTQYKDTIDFLMTKDFVAGKTLDDIVDSLYGDLSVNITYSTIVNGSAVAQAYRSPIGPGILRILDSLGYSTLLTLTNYTTEGNVKTPKARSVCDDSNNNHAVTKQTPAAASDAGFVRPQLWAFVILPAALLSPIVYAW